MPLFVIHDSVLTACFCQCYQPEHQGPWASCYNVLVAKFRFLQLVLPTCPHWLVAALHLSALGRVSEVFPASFKVVNMVNASFLAVAAFYARCFSSRDLNFATL